MLPTLKSGQVCGLNKLAYAFSSPQRGDLVSISTGKERIAKRIVGLPGEEIQLKHGRVYVEGKKLEEPYLILSEFSNNIAAGRVEPDCFVVASDNRRHGSLVAVVSERRIIGRICASR
jgi:signal peptidase I